MADPTSHEVDEFIRVNDVDERAAQDLRNCSADIQRKVLARGELSTARNPSAAVLARIRDARSSPSVTGGSTSAEVEDFIRHNDVDESAADMLRSASPTVQRVVLGRGELKTARNPSSALLSRIRDAKMGSGGGSDGGSLSGSPLASQQMAALAMPGFGGMPGYMGYPAYGGMGMGMGYPGYPGYPGYSQQPQPDSRGYGGGAQPAMAANPYAAYPGYGQQAAGAYGAAYNAYSQYYGAMGYPGVPQPGQPVPLQDGQPPQASGGDGGEARRSRSRSRSRSYSSSSSRKNSRRRRR